ncbi:35372_t:CDS:2 [Gigaspora margarita]|uniref:35372_t:CDS:1 n=1 Tax=Gigaspora margarita TaxID=4874 RepID=A0ABN7UG59_GIGMA|nr:35372_t:CDS:2 [Gigaspora margarita]
MHLFLNYLESRAAIKSLNTDDCTSAELHSQNKLGNRSGVKLEICLQNKSAQSYDIIQSKNFSKLDLKFVFLRVSSALTLKIKKIGYFD